MKSCDIFHISAQNIDCGYSLEPPRRGGSNGYTQSVLSRNKKNIVYPCKPQFYYIKVGFEGIKIIYACFRDETQMLMEVFAVHISYQTAPHTARLITPCDVPITTAAHHENKPI